MLPYFSDREEIVGRSIFFRNNEEIKSIETLLATSRIIGCVKTQMITVSEDMNRLDELEKFTIGVNISGINKCQFVIICDFYEDTSLNECTLELIGNEKWSLNSFNENVVKILFISVLTRTNNETYQNSLVKLRQFTRHIGNTIVVVMRCSEEQERIGFCDVLSSVYTKFYKHKDADLISMNTEIRGLIHKKNKAANRECNIKLWDSFKTKLIFKPKKVLTML
uniref:Uncharacterized protein n=1 Tax=viral metagenome TaxID=1070528 RepID=A0A6C0JT99_9ZZZZ